VSPEAPANVEPVPAGNHDIEQEKRWRFPFRIRNQIGWSVKQPGLKPC
jgi:hypothetical protein